MHEFLIFYAVIVTSVIAAFLKLFCATNHCLSKELMKMQCIINCYSIRFL